LLNRQFRSPSLHDVARRFNARSGGDGFLRFTCAHGNEFRLCIIGGSNDWTCPGAVECGWSQPYFQIASGVPIALYGLSRDESYQALRLLSFALIGLFPGLFVCLAGFTTSVCTNDAGGFAVVRTGPHCTESDFQN
jgi:hypothetical protein